MIALLRKEIAATSPYWLGAVAILVLSVVAVLFDGGLLLEPYGTRFRDVSAAPLWPCGFALLLGHGLVAPEAVHGQIHFLDGLPTTRTRVFLAKIIAGLLPCLLLVAGATIVDLALEEVVTVPFRTSGAAIAIEANLAVLATLWFFLGLGMLLSWLRGLAFGAVLALLFAAALVTELTPAASPWVPLFDSDYGAFSWVRTGPELDWRPLLLWAGVGSICMALSGLVFVGPGEWVLRGTSWVGTTMRWLGTALLLLLALSLGVVGAAQLYGWIPDVRPMAQRTVGPLRVLYFQDEEAHVDAVLADAPQQVEALARLLGHDGPVPPIDVEFLGGSRNHLGVFTGGKVRVVPDASTNVVLHEMGHVIAHRVSDHQRMHDDHHVRFFHEGLANWVAAEVLGESQLPNDVGWLYLMGQARFDLIVEDHLFSAEQDLAQVYTLGQVFVDALVDERGVGALGCTLRSLGRRAPGSKAGLALWYQAASDCNYVLDQVLERWRAKLSAAAAALDPVPRITASVSSEGGLTLRVTGGAAYERTCRFRDNASAPAHELYHSPVQSGACAVPRGSLAGPTFDYQLGFAAGPDAWIYDRWVRDIPFD